ncbi:MAG: exo-alpha-sialidase [Bacteroidales bacterium]|nr:exo-alpha-sialidase [Bacteroidales bacterium]
MKIRLISYLGAAVLAVACSVEAQKDCCTVIYASVDESARTAFGELDGNSRSVLWQPGDRLNVNGSVSDPLGNAYVPSRSAQFTFSNVVLSTPYHVVSPSSAVSSYTSGSAIVTIPSQQVFTDGSYDPEAGLFLSVGNNADVSLSPFFSMMRFTVGEGNHTSHLIRRITLTARGGEQMSGAFTTDYTQLTDRSGGSSSVSVISADGFELGTSVVITFAPKTYSQGISIEIEDKAGHYMRKKSTASFIAEAGHLYNTELAFDPTGTYIGGDFSDVNVQEPGLHTWKDMNTEEHAENSHASAFSRSNITMIGGTYVQIPHGQMGLISGNTGVVYPRFIKTSENNWLMFYHYGNSSTWAGNYCSYMRSSDLVNWTFEKKLFNFKSNQTSPYYNTEDLSKTYTRGYAGADLCTLPDGRILAVAATRPMSNYKLRPLDSGLAIRYSSDGGHTWTDDQLVLMGTCWEPFPLVLPSGRIQIYYTDARPYYPSGNSTWNGTEVMGSGVSYIYSDDNGASWVSDDGNGNHLVAYRQLRTVSDVDGTPLYSDQMPTVLVLNAGAGLAGAGESLKKSLGSGFRICTAYSGPDMDWGTPVSVGDFPEDRDNNFTTGASPYLLQFHSGETVLTYNISYNSGNQFRYMMGDAQARNFFGSRPVMPSGISGLDESASAIVSLGFWGSTRVTGSHTLVAGVGGSTDPMTMQVAQFYLNHDISAPSVTSVELDAKPNDWHGTEALFAGSSTSDQAILRASHNSSTLYLLVESVGNASAVHVDLSVGGTLKRISMNASGLISSALSGVTASCGVATTEDGQMGFVCEVAVPLSSLGSPSFVPVKLTLEGTGYSDTFQLASSSVSALPRIVLE